MSKEKNKSIILTLLIIVILIFIATTIYIVYQNKQINNGDNVVGSLKENVKMGGLELSIVDIKKNGYEYNTSLKIKNNYNKAKKIEFINLHFIDKNDTAFAEVLAIVNKNIDAGKYIIIDTATDISLDTAVKVKYTYLS